MRRQARDRQVTEGLATSARRLAGSQLAVNVGTTLLTWLLLRVARPGDIALIPLAALLGGIVGVVVRMGTGTQLIRMVPRIQADSHGDRRVEDVAGAALRAGVLGGMVLLPLSVVGGWWLHANILEGEPWSVILALLGTAAVVGYSQNSPLWLQAAREYKQLAVANAISSLVEQLACVGLYLLVGPYGILGGIVLGRMILMAYASACIHRMGVDRRLTIRAAMRPPAWVRDGQVALALNSAVRFVLLRSDTIVLAALLPARDMATYWVAYKMVSYVFIIAQSVFKPAVTEMAALFHRPASLQWLTDRVAVTTAVAFAGLAGAVAAIAPWFMRYYGGPTYAGGSVAMAILALYSFMYALYSVPQSVVLASHDAGKLLRLEAVTGVVGLAATAAGAILLGINGVALGQVAGMLLGLALATVAARAFVHLSDLSEALKSGVLAFVCFAWVWLPGVRTSLVFAPAAVVVSSILYVLLQARWLSRTTFDVWSSVIPGRLRSFLPGGSSA